jgi:redox-sensitive bicupin YhaK (pirin superfamily)
MTAVDMTIAPRPRDVGNGKVRRLLPYRERRMVGPFIFADLMGPDELAPGRGVDVDAHPHIGLSTLTYLFGGQLVHRDSTGAVQTIQPGAVNWMTAGAGVCHTERTPPDDRPRPSELWGLQTWIALPDSAQDAPPFFEHHPADAFAAEARGASTVRVVAGEGWGVRSPVGVSSPLILAELRLDGETPIPLDTPASERAVINIDGDIRVAGTALPAGHLAVLERAAPVEVGGRGRAMVLGGEPVGKRYIWWNFVHGDPDRIEEAKRDWTAQRFPEVPGDHQPWVPLPS